MLYLKIILDSHRNCKNSSELPCSLSAASPRITSYITMVKLSVLLTKIPYSYFTSFYVVFFFFGVYNSMKFMTCIDSCNHQHNQDSELFITLRKLSHTISLQSHPSPDPNSWQPTDPFSFSITILLLSMLYKWIHTVYILLKLVFFFKTQSYALEIYPSFVACINNLLYIFFIVEQYSIIWMYHSLSIC